MGADAGQASVAVVVGVARLTLVLPEASTLKDKRSVRQSVTTRVRTRFNVSVAEVDTQDVPQTLTMAIACISNDTAHAHGLLEKAVRHVEDSRLDAYLADYVIEMW